MYLYHIIFIYDIFTKYIHVYICYIYVCVYDSRLTSRIYIQCLQFNNKKKTSQYRNRQKSWTYIFTKENIQIDNNHMKKFSIINHQGNTKLKPQKHAISHLPKWLKSEWLEIPSVEENVKLEVIHCCWWECRNDTRTLENFLESILKLKTP